MLATCFLADRATIDLETLEKNEPTLAMLASQNFEVIRSSFHSYPQRQVEDPDLQLDLVTLGFIQNLSIENGDAVSFEVELTTPACPVQDEVSTCFYYTSVTVTPSQNMFSNLID